MKKRKSITDIAKIAGVSPTTVQNALHGRKKCMKEDTYQKVMGVLCENDYVEMAAPKLLNGKKEHMVGVALAEQVMESDAITEIAKKLLQLERENFEEQRYTIFHVSSKIEEVATFFQAWPTIKIYLHGYENEEKLWLEEKMGICIDALL